MRKTSISTLPFGGMFSLNIKSSSDSIFLNINIERPSFHGYSMIFASMPGRPHIIKLWVYVMMLIMQWISEIIWIYFIYFFLKLIPDGFDSHNVVKHFSQIFFVIICSIWRVNSGYMERFTWILLPSDVVIVQELVVIRWTVLYNNLFCKGDHIAESECWTWSVTSYNWSCFAPIKSYICFNSSSKYHDCIITQNISLLLWVSIEKFRACVVDKVGDTRCIEGDITNLLDIFLKMCEGAIELILFSKSVLSNKIKVAGITLNSPILEIINLWF